MDTFPKPSAVTDFSEIPVKKANRQTSAAGYTISFGRGTVIKRKFRLSGRYTAAEKAAAIAFLDTHQGAVFIFSSQDATDTTDYQVIFLADEIEFKWNSRRRTWDADIEFGEV